VVPLFNCVQIRVHCSCIMSWMPQTALSDARYTDAVVLCVDDDKVILQVIKLTLEKNGFTVLTATHWRYALDIFENNPIDLVMLDYEMPEMKGHEVAVWIRSINPEVPIILHSGSSDIPAIAAKVTDAFIPKGVEPYVLVAAISNLIMKSRVGAVQRGTESPGDI
jgi:CheY-like chemotaxis protein